MFPFCILIGFHCLGGPGFSKGTVIILNVIPYRTEGVATCYLSLQILANLNIRFYQNYDVKNHLDQKELKFTDLTEHLTLMAFAL